MFNFLNTPISLPPSLQMLGDTPLKSALLTIIVWLVAAGLLYLVVFILAGRLARRTATEVDDVLLRASRTPVLLIALLLGIRDAVDLFRMQAESVVALEGWLDVGVIVVVAYWVWRVFRDIVLYYGEEYVERTESSLDDILLPATQQFAPLIIFGLALAMILQRLGFDPAGILVAIGGLTFIAAFAFQDSLSNIFSGLSMLVDTPFRYGDLILLDDDLYVIQRIGLRVTELYNADRHLVVLMPNSKMANERLTNITRPTAALMIPVTLRTTFDADPRLVMETLQEVANAHPNVLGHTMTKVEAMEARTHRFLDEGQLDEAACLVRETARMVVEGGVNSRLEALTDHLDRLAATIESMEAGGLDADERLRIQAALDEVARHIHGVKQTITLWLLLLRHVYADVAEELGPTVDDLQAFTDRYQSECEALIQAGKVTLLGDMPIRRKENVTEARAMDSLVYRRGMLPFDNGFPDIDEHADFVDIIKTWNKRLARLDGLYHAFVRALKDGEERRLDDLARNLRDYVYTGLKETTPEWKYPQVNFTSFEAGFTFTLEAFVDDVRREHYERHERVETELRRDIVAQLRAKNVEFSSLPRLMLPGT